MNRLNLFWATQKLVRDRRGQDLIEYALLAASFAVVAGAIFPTTVMPNVSTIFSKIVSSFNATSQFSGS